MDEQLRARPTILAAILMAPLIVLLTPAAPTYAAPGSTVRVSVDSDGRPADDYSDSPVISPDGSTVAFVSRSALLHPSGTPATAFYAHDRRTGATELLSVRPDGAPFEPSGLHGNPVLSADGRYALFTWASTPSDQTTMHLYRRDLVADVTELVSATPAGGAPDDEVQSFTLDGSGNLAAFTSPATDILDDGRGGGLFVRDLTTRVTMRIAEEAWDPALSGDGTTLVYSAPDGAGTPVIWVRDLATGTTQQLLPGVGDESYAPSVSQDGRRIVFMAYGTGIGLSDTDPSYDWFLADRDTGQVGLINRTSSGEQAMVTRAFLAADGRHVGLLGAPLDGTGRFGIANLYVKDLDNGALDYVAVDSAGTPVHAPVNNGYHYLSADGRHITWSSPSPDFVPDDTDQQTDIFVHDNAAPATTVSGSGVVTTDPGGAGATWEAPLQTTVNSPDGGSVSITQLGSTVAATAPSGYAVLGQAVDIAADPAPAGLWLTITFRLDASSVASTTALDDVTVTRNGSALARCTAPDDAGPCVASVTRAPDDDVVITVHTPQASRWVPVLRVVSPDTTPPEITITSPTAGQAVTQGATLVASYSCSDEGSGVTSCVGTVPSGSTLSTSQVGWSSLSVTSTDAAGNTASATRSYRVVYDWQGFRHPVDEAPVVNRVKAGSIVPLAFALGGDRGLDVLDGTPVAAATACDRAAPVDRLERFLKKGAGTLTYATSTATYTYGYAVPRGWAGSCRTLTLRLADGTTHDALLEVVK